MTDAVADAAPDAVDAAVPSGPSILTAPTEQTFLNEVSPTYTVHTLFGSSYLTLPITAPGQGFYLEAKITLGECGASISKACEDSLLIKCWAGVPRASNRVGDMEYAAENYPANTPDRSMVARMMYISTTSSPVNCQPDLGFEGELSHPTLARGGVDHGQAARQDGTGYEAARYEREHARDVPALASQYRSIRAPCRLQFLRWFAAPRAGA